MKIWEEEFNDKFSRYLDGRRCGDKTLYGEVHLFITELLEPNINLINALSELDCGDNSCLFAKNKTGMRTNGGCRCIKDLPTKLQLALKKIWWANSQKGSE